MSAELPQIDHSYDCILLVGASGYIGHYLLHQLHFGSSSSLTKYSIIATYNHNKPLFEETKASEFKPTELSYNTPFVKYIKLDLTENSVVDACIKKIYEKWRLKPSIIIHCAGLSHISKCEKNLELANSINCPSYFITKLKERYIKLLKIKLPLLIAFSTDHVYDGTLNKPPPPSSSSNGNNNNNGNNVKLDEYGEESKVNPINNYGSSKQLFENVLLSNWKENKDNNNDNNKNGSKYNKLIIFRLSVVYGPSIGQFFKFDDTLNRRESSVDSGPNSGNKIDSKGSTTSNASTKSNASAASNGSGTGGGIMGTSMNVVSAAGRGLKGLVKAPLAAVGVIDANNNNDNKAPTATAAINDASNPNNNTNNNNKNEIKNKEKNETKLEKANKKIHGTFLQFIVESLQDNNNNNKKVEIFANEYRNFICIFDVLEVIETIVERFHYFEDNKGNNTCDNLMINGVYNLGGPKSVSRMEFAQMVCDIVKLDKKKLVEIDRMKDSKNNNNNVPNNGIPSILRLNINKLEKDIIGNRFTLMPVYGGINLCWQCINVMKLDSEDEIDITDVKNASRMSLFVHSVGDTALYGVKATAYGVKATANVTANVGKKIVSTAVSTVTKPFRHSNDATNANNGESQGAKAATTTTTTTTTATESSKTVKKENDANNNNNNNNNLPNITLTENEKKEDMTTDDQKQLEMIGSPRKISKIPIPNFYEKIGERLSMEGLLKQANKTFQRHLKQKDFIDKLLHLDKNGEKRRSPMFPIGIVFLSTLSLSVLGIGAIISTGIVIFRLDKGYEHEIERATTDKNDTSSEKNKGRIHWTQRWSGPCALLESGGSFGIGFGIGSKVDHVAILSHPRHVNTFVTNGGQLTLSGNAGVAIINQGASVSVGGTLSSNKKAAETKGMALKTYGASVGVSVSSTVISVRKDCNKKFYNNVNIKVKDIANGNGNKYMKYNEDYQEIIDSLDAYFNVRPSKGHAYYDETLDKELVQSQYRQKPPKPPSVPKEAAPKAPKQNDNIQGAKQ